ncbi:RidA family protein [uncultured Brevundimonas sp.]|uniref:RidA family protein n=1 Tax=uncultured Brevundimonas sp. TaxID=213418 RepID=UPI0025ECA95F|nr:RidA family protein [uncultured Brevundimonas sp.]
MTQRDAVFPANPHALYEQHRYSPAVRSGDFLFVSGQVGARPDGSPEPDVATQAQLAFDNLNAILEAAGGSFADVVDVTLFMVDPDAIFETIWPVMERNWGEKPYPTITAVGVTWLAGFQFELKAIARIPA